MATINRIALGLMLGAALLALAGGCRSKKDLGGTDMHVPRDLNAMYTALADGQPRYTHFYGKARIKAETSDGNLGAQLSLRMIRDSLIWIRIDKLGFELGRALISPDSVWLVDRLNREYYAMTYQSALAEFSAPFTFSDLQGVLAGGAVAIDGGRVLRAKDDRKNSLILENSHLTARYWFGPEMRIVKGLLTDQNGRRVELENGDFRRVLNENLPFERYLSMFGPDESALIRLQFAEIELDVPKSIAFAIPDHYLRVD